jgi:cell division septation protein DedD
VFVISPLWRRNIIPVWEQTRRYYVLFAWGMVLLLGMAFLLDEARNLSTADKVFYQNSSMPPISPPANGWLDTRSTAVIEAKSGEVPVGAGNSLLSITVSNVEKLGATTILIEYDTALLKPVQCRRNPLFSTGLCNLLFDHDNDGAPDSVRFNVISLEGVNAPAGSTVTLVDLTWQAAGTPTIGAMTLLSITVDSIANTEGIPLNVSSQPGTITFVEAPTATATPTPTSPATPTPTSTATPTPTSPATPTPTSTATSTPTSTATPTPTPTLTFVPIKSLYLPAISSHMNSSP